MPLIRCFSDPSHSTAWIICYAVLALYYFLLLLYCVIPLIRHRKSFFNLSLLNRLSRFGFTIVLAIKFLSAVIAQIIGHFADRDFNFGLAGLLCCEFPAYAISSCYTLVLMFWLSICTEVLPARYKKIFPIMRAILIVFNVMAYLALIATLVVVGDPEFADVPNRGSFNGIAALSRDFVLMFIFTIFVITLRIGLSNDTEIEASVDERNLIRFTVILSVFLLLRGGVSLAQGLVFTEESTECGKAFLALLMVVELLLEGGPFLFLIRVNNDFLVDDTGLERESSTNVNVRTTELIGAFV
jgi:hypothetical protein